MESESLRHKLADWTDWDLTAFVLAQSIGLMSSDTQFHLEAKHVFWTDNPIGNALHNILRELVDAGVLENRSEPDDQYRWNPRFVATWTVSSKALDGEPQR